MAKEPLIWAPDEGTYVSVMGDTYRILIAGKQTDNAYAAIDMLVPTGGGPGPHAHPDFEETFYVIEGEIEVTSETGTYIAGKGSYVVIPKGGMVHQFKNKAETTAHLLCVVVPSGLEELFLEAGTRVEAGRFLPPPDQSCLEKLKAVAEKHGQQLFPPDYFRHN
ncbi:cupin domain-containing protein [Olivibacter sitiensis]|uniref:cupin domain-containing protein n=1 Tax=Olivibacter sitiensis TaxID=376470 RepID=UPI0003F52EAA|nr:cupin domain-containing protein [Olivibacter sitiensis]